MHAVEQTWYPISPRGRDELLAESLFIGRPSITMLRRWAREGVRGVRLRMTYCGNRAGVTLQDAHAFRIAVEEKRNAPIDRVLPTKRAKAEADRISRQTLERAGAM